jgi:hypothetical protein
VRNTRKVAEKGFKMAFLLNKLAMINFCEIILENIKNILLKLVLKYSLRAIHGRYLRKDLNGFFN